MQNAELQMEKSTEYKMTYKQEPPQYKENDHPYLK